jgi:hypothetical protein
MCEKCRIKWRGYINKELRAKNYKDKKKGGICISCHNKAIAGKIYCEGCRTSIAQKHRKLKDEAYNFYGGYKCVCCGITEPTMLTLDHVDGGGTRHKKEIGRGYHYYRWLKNNGFPTKLQVMCYNCNSSKHLNGGICVHKRPNPAS